MIHHNAWRTQRGLPERSVSVLRAWLFENFLHLYSKDSDKHMLAKQTGLTCTQHQTPVSSNLRGASATRLRQEMASSAEPEVTMKPCLIPDVWTLDTLKYWHFDF
ncbi:hypothetical protein RJT34_13813 [Clitoria ternatea]|uniref:Transcription factor n=1 Tax=Clitoria ternatea TaxID=43366 RepID=A0AAN9PLT6_CLITE